MKWIFKWLFRLFILAVVLVVVFLLSLNTILRVLVEHNIRAQTGLDAEIGRFSLGFAGPTIEIKDLKIYNTADFGGTLFLSIPEIHAEFDRAALARREVHVTLMRFNLGELDIVKNEAGRTNIFSLGLTVPSKGGAGIFKVGPFSRKNGPKFKGIDLLTVWVGKAKYIDLKDPGNSHGQTIGIENCPIRNVKSAADLGGLELLIGLRGGDFFQSLADPKRSTSDIFKILGQ